MSRVARRVSLVAVLILVSVASKAGKGKVLILSTAINESTSPQRGPMKIAQDSNRSQR